MPKMGDGMEEGTLLGWLKKEGEKVKSGEIIGSIQTDKATLDLEAPGSGLLAGYLIKDGDTVPVGKPIAMILKEGESLPANWGSSSASVAAAVTEPPKETVDAAVSSTSTSSEASAPPTSGRVIASPLARRVAREMGIDLSGLVGSGPGGRIVERDIQSAGSNVPIQPAVAATASAADKVVELNRLRQITAQRTHQAKQDAPHFYVTVEVDVQKILDLRAQFDEEGSGKVSINDFVLRASVKALRDVPEVNATFNGTSVTQFGAVHLGVAAAVDEGLLVPVIKNAQDMSLREISSRAKELIHKAREGKLHPDEMSGSTFSISNMGMLNVDNFTAIINTPNAAIIAVSTARKQVVVNDQDELEVRVRMNLTGSFDHRVVDGAGGAKFMNVLRDYLQNPTRLLS